jgi:sec-independent protein translocase protein TatA
MGAMLSPMDLSGSELLIVLLVIVVLFGSTRLPKLARSLGEAQREFRRGVSRAHDDDEPKTVTTTATPAASPAPPAPPSATPVVPAPPTPAPAQGENGA